MRGHDLRSLSSDYLRFLLLAWDVMAEDFYPSEPLALRDGLRHAIRIELADKSRCSFQDVRRAAVTNRKGLDFGFLPKIIFEAPQKSRRPAAPTIDALVVISNYINAVLLTFR